MSKNVTSFLKLVSGFMLFTAGMVLTSCNYEGDSKYITLVNNVVSVDAEEESDDFINEGLPLYDGSDEASGTFYVRFYNDNQYVPYVSVRYFLEQYGNFKIEDFSYSNGKYKYDNNVNGKRFSMVINTKADTIYCPEWYGYTYKTNYSEQVYKLIEKYRKVVSVFIGQHTRTFDLHSYGMKIYAGSDDAYVPLYVLSQLFSCPDYKRFVYNGNGVYYIGPVADTVYNNKVRSKWYWNDDGTAIRERPAELIDLSYNMLCFTHDYLYGKPGYYGFADDGDGYADSSIVAVADKLNFDQLLKTYDPETRSLLKSSSYLDYVKGLIRLCNYTYGDCHAVAEINKSFPFSANMITELQSYITNNYSKKILKYKNSKNELKQLRQNNGKVVLNPSTNKDEPVSYELLSDGKTFVIRFDSFEFDEDAWGSYYGQQSLVAEPDPDPTTEEIEQGKVAVPNDTTGLFYRSFYKILNDSAYANVKNVIIDLTCNGGGVIWANERVQSYLLENVYYYYYDVNTGSMYIDNIKSDLNLDGKVDDADKVYQRRLACTNYKDENGVEQNDGRGLNFVILTSFNSFSCGNAMPCSCSEAGIPVIGERSGGGSCWVWKACTVDGLPYSYSASSRWSYKDGTSYENGAPVTVELTHEQFYDDAKLISVMAELFD